MNQKEWNKKLEKTTGFPISEMFTALSSDQLIGKIREAEDGKDPFADKRMEKFEQFLDVHSNKRVNPNNPFRDDRDREIWSTIEFRTVLLPPKERNKRIPTYFGPNRVQLEVS